MALDRVTTSANVRDERHHRVAHVMTRYLRGGSERRAHDMVSAFPEATHHVVVGAESDLDLARANLPDAEITFLSSLVREPNPYRDIVALRWLTRFLRTNAFDLVVTHQSKAGVLGRSAARRHGIPTIHSLSMPSFGPGYPRWQSAVFSGIETRLAGSTHAFAVVGMDVSRRYAAIGVAADKLHVVRSGVRLPEPAGSAHADARRDLGLPESVPLIVYVGSLDARKNVLDLPVLLRRVLGAEGARSAHLAVAGEGPLGGPLADRLRADGLGDAATLLGYVADPLPLMHTADVVVLLSKAEGVPQVLVQAGAVGTPFVAYDVDGVHELVDLGADGIAVPPGDLAAAADATRSLLDRGKALRAGLDLSAWGPDAIVDGHRRVFLSVLGERCDRCRPSLPEDDVMERTA